MEHIIRPSTWCCFAWLLCRATLLPAQTTAYLQTADTIIQLQAGSNAPLLVKIKSPLRHAWHNHSSEPPIHSVEMDGRETPLKWQFNQGASRIEPHRVAFVYETELPHLRLTWEWRSRAASGPVEHQIHIENLSDRRLWLPLQDSIQFNLSVKPEIGLEQLYIEKGANTPSEVGTHLVPVPPGYKWQGTSSTYAHPKANELREIIPWFLLEESSGSKNGWYMGIEFSGRTQLTVERSSQGLKGSAGLNADPAPFRTRLEPGESFDTPAIFFGASKGGVDATGNVLRRWVRRVLGSPLTWDDSRFPLLTNNSWGGGMNVNEVIARGMIRDASELGLEMFHLDAGWFRGVGDWYPNPKKFPGGLAVIADYAHQRGMKFGLWVDWTQAALDTEPGALNARDPKVQDWMVTDLPPDWKPEEFKGQTIDLGVPAAHEWAQREVERIVDDYHLDMLEHDGYLVAQGCDRTDHPHAPPNNWNKCIYKAWGSYWVDSSNSSDVSYYAVRAYYDIYSQLKKHHPGLLLEVCDDGGRMVDFGSAAHADYFSITDTYDPLSNRRAFYDTSHVLPSAMLENYVEKWQAPRLENFLYMLRSGMMGWLTVMMDTTSWTSEQHAVAKDEFQLYKKQLRPLIRDADLYHISFRPDGVNWDAIEYFDPKTSRGAVYVFRGSKKSESSHSFVFKGITASAVYQVHFHDHSSHDRSVSGRELLATGLKVTLPTPQSSELIFFEERK